MSDNADANYYNLLDRACDALAARLAQRPAIAIIRVNKTIEGAHDAFEDLLHTVWQQEKAWNVEEMWQLRLAHTPLVPRKERSL